MAKARVCVCVFVALCLCGGGFEGGKLLMGRRCFPLGEILFVRQFLFSWVSMGRQNSVAFKNEMLMVL